MAAAPQAAAPATSGGAANAVPAIETVGVSRTFDKVRYVLDQVDLQVYAGELVVLIGRSGSGKTTLLNLLAGLDEPTRGQVLLDEMDLAKMDDDTRTRVRLERIGVVFQRFHLIPELTVAENVQLPMRLAGRKDARKRSAELVDFLGIAEQARDFPATLSGGETQRAAIARALANEPSVVLADEPTANLDEENARRILGEFRRVARELGTAVLIASHDPLVRTVADVELTLTDGRVVWEEGDHGEGEGDGDRGGDDQPGAGGPGARPQAPADASVDAPAGPERPAWDPGPS